MGRIVLDGEHLDTGAVARVAAGDDTAALEGGVGERMDLAARWFSGLSMAPVLQDRWPEYAALEPGEVPEAFVLAHCGGLGDPLAPSLVRALLVARANALASGATAARSEVAELLLAMLDADVIPLVPSRGLAGTAADHTPMAHVARVAFRWGGDAWLRGTRTSAEAAMDGLPVVEPTQKDVHALLHGTSVVAAGGALAVERARRLLLTAEAAAALSLEAVMGPCGLGPLAVEARGHPEAAAVAERLRGHLEGSEAPRAMARPLRSFRCVSSVLGAAWEAHTHTAAVIDRELNAVTDDVLVFPAAEVVEHCGAHPAAAVLALDHLKLALTQAILASERRSAWFSSLGATVVHSGRIAAELAAQVRAHAVPSALDIGTVGIVDHAPLGARAAVEILRLTEAAADVLTVELLLAAWLVAGRYEPVGRGTEVTMVRVLERTGGEGRVFQQDLASVGAAVREGILCDGAGTW